MAVWLSMGCAASPQDKRLGFYGRAFENYSEEMKAHIIEGRVMEGMSREQVYMARGVPAEIERSEGSPAVEERWIYHTARSGVLVVEFRRGRVTDVSGDKPPPAE
jgi:hypothetical protein